MLIPGFSCVRRFHLNLKHWSNKNQKWRDLMTLLLTVFSLPEILFVCLFDEKMKNLIWRQWECCTNMELQCYRFYSDLAQVHQGKLMLAAYSVTKSWYFSGLIHNITVSYCSMFIFPIHFSHFQSMLICDPGSLATIIGIFFLGQKETNSLSTILF